MRMPATPARRRMRDLQTQIDDLGRAHHVTAMAVAELSRANQRHEETDLSGALSAAVELLISLQTELDDTRRRLVAQEAQADHTATALQEFKQQHAVLSRLIEAELATSTEKVDGFERT